MTRLDDLVTRFLATTDGAGNAMTTHRGNVEVDLIVDGDDYFNEVYPAIAATTEDDHVLILGWTMDTNMRKGLTLQLGDLLARQQQAGVHVHVVLNGSVWQNAPFLPFGQCLAALFDLREDRIPPGTTTPPLDQQVLFDFSGAPTTGSHHQKVVVIHHGDDTVAYVGGIDFWPDRDDTSFHPGTVIRIRNDPWGWHDVVVRLRGAPVADVWANFVSRWDETRGLPVRHALHWNPGWFPVPIAPYNPSPGASAPVAPASLSAPSPNPDIAVQVLRSRYPLKLPRERPPVPWIGPPVGGIRQVYATLLTAITAAEHYIYIEDQFAGDTFAPDPGPVAAFSLMGALLAAASRGVKIILVTSGKSDMPVPMPTPTFQTEVIDRLPLALKPNVVLWKVKDILVHSKLILIDDVFGAAGSANIQSRSMFGVDQELHVAVVDGAVGSAGTPAGIVRDWRVRLWAEHLSILPPPAAVLAPLQDIGFALGMWRTSWRVGGSPGARFTSNNPVGYAPTADRRIFVGPLPGP